MKKPTVIDYEVWSLAFGLCRILDNIKLTNYHLRSAMYNTPLYHDLLKMVKTTYRIEYEK